jgi:hypothetical protein
MTARLPISLAALLLAARLSAQAATPATSAAAAEEERSATKAQPSTVVNRATVVMAAVKPVATPPLRDIAPIVDTSEVKYLVDNRETEVRFGLPAKPLADGALQSSARINAPAPAPPATPVNFDGTPVNNGAPPDSDGRVGPNHYVQFVNTRFQIWDKSGHSLYGPFLGKTLWQFLGGVCAVHNDGDPVAAYDAMADRWILTQFTTAVPAGPDQGSHQCFAVSKTGDPLGAYYLYDFRTSTDPALFEDYPHLGVWPDSYYMVTHEFNGNSFSQENLYALERAAILAGMPARLQVNRSFDAVNFGIGALPADLDGLTPPPPGAPNYVVRYSSQLNDGRTGNPPNVLDIWQAAATWGATPTLTVTGPTLVPLATFNDVFSCLGVNRACIPEPLNPATPQDYLDVVGDRMMFRNAYRNFGDHESLVLNHTVNVAASGADQAAVRWYEVRSPGGNPVIFQQSTYSPTDVPPASRWMGSIAMDASGDIALGYTKSSSQIFPSPMITGRLAADPASTMGAESVVFAGAGSQVGTGNRWGDYSAMSVDPRDGCTFWYTSEYLPASGSFNWHMRIAAYRFPSCVTPPQGTLQGTLTNCTSHAPLSDALVTLDNGFSGATDAAGHYSIVTSPGSYQATPSSPLRSCTAGTPQPVTIVDGATATKDFCLDGVPKYAFAAAAVDDSSGNHNGFLNRGECDNLSVTVTNVGCHDATGVNGTLATSSANLSLGSNASPFPDLAIGQSRTESSPYKVNVGTSYVCGTPALFTLALGDNDGGSGSLAFSLPTCGPSNSPIVFANQVLDASSGAQVSRLGRDGSPSDCSAAKKCPGPLQTATGNRFYNTHQLHSPPGTAPVCVNVKVDASCGAGNEIFSAAYSGLASGYDKTMLCGGYLGDIGVTGLGATVPSATYSVVVPPDQDFFVVVDTINSPTETCSGSGHGYAVTVSGYYDTSTVAAQLTLTCPAPPPVCVQPGTQSTPVTYPAPVVSGNCGASATPACNPSSGSSFNLGTTAVQCSVSVGQATANCAFNQVVATLPDATITAPIFIVPNSTGNVASVPNAGDLATYSWSVANGTITGGAGTRQITFTAGSSGAVTLQVQIQSAAGCANTGSLIIPTGFSLYTVAPCRLLDTRTGSPLSAGTAHKLAIGGQGSNCAIPATARAVSVNVTVLDPTSQGYLTFYAKDPPPIQSTLDFGAGQTRANNAVLTLNPADASILVKPLLASGSGTVDLIIDVNGYFQ